MRHMADFSSESLDLQKKVKEEDDNIKPMKEFESPEKLYDELIASVRKYHPSTDISLIEKAYHVARDAHEGQARKSGEPYICLLYTSSAWHAVSEPVLPACASQKKKMHTAM